MTFWVSLRRSDEIKQHSLYSSLCSWTSRALILEVILINCPLPWLIELECRWSHCAYWNSPLHTTFVAMTNPNAVCQKNTNKKEKKWYLCPLQQLKLTVSGFHYIQLSGSSAFLQHKGKHFNLTERLCPWENTICDFLLFIWQFLRVNILWLTLKLVSK